MLHVEVVIHRWFDFSGNSDVDSESEKPMTTNILIHMKNNMLKSLWNSKFGVPFHQPIDDEVCTVEQARVTRT